MGLVVEQMIEEMERLIHAIVTENSGIGAILYTSNQISASPPQWLHTAWPVVLPSPSATI